MPSSSILLLSDEATSVEAIRSSLAAVGYLVTVTADPDEARRVAGGHALIVIDSVPRPRTQQQVCRDLRSMPALAGIPVLCIAQTADVEERVRFLEAGADEVMAKPFDRRELEARVEALLLRYQHARDLAPMGLPGAVMPATRKTLAFFSPKGGMGTTTIAVNLAVALAEQRPERVALLDLDLQWGQVAIHLNLHPRLTIAELSQDSQALAEPELMRTYAERHPSGLAVYCAPPRPDHAEIVTAELIGKVLAGMRSLYDVVLIDAGSILDDRSLTVLEEADDIVLPFYPEIASIKALLSMLEVLADAGGLGNKTTFVVNHVFPKELVKLKDVENTLGARVAFELPNDPVIFIKAVNEGVPVVRGAPRSVPAERFMKLAQQLMGQQRAPAMDAEERHSGIGSLLRRT